MALSIVFMSGFAKKGAEFVFANGMIGQFQKLDDTFGREIERNFQFSENDIVGELLFNLGLGPFFFSSLGVDETVEENGHGGVVTDLVSRIGLLFHPIADLRTGDLMVGRREDGDHF